MKHKIVRRSLPTETLPISSSDELLGRIYAMRGIRDPKDLDRGIQELLPYALLSNMDKAVDCLQEAIEKFQHIMVIGDFDADGATSTALAVRALRAFGAYRVSYLVPNRFEYGYGLTPEIVIEGAKKQPDLILTVDHGIASNEGVQKANELGIKVVITDHHLPPKDLPEAAAIVNPNLKDDAFPSKNLAGVGVVFYVLLALRAKLRETNWFEKHDLKVPNMADYLDLVSLGTVADVVPLDKNNRILIHQGIMRIHAGKVCPGIRALVEVAGRDTRNMIASDFAYAVGPRLNAAGRLDDMSLGIACLLSDDYEEAKDMANELDTLNRQRRAIEAEMSEQAMGLIEALNLTDKKLPLGLALYDESWHQGVVGILAARLKERTHRPIIAFAKEDDKTLKGSARSVSGLNIKDAIDAISTANPGMVLKFGGHAMAAGLSIPMKKLKEFQKAFAEEVGRHLSEENLCGQVISDGALEDHQLTLKMAEVIRDAGPWGQQFPEPIFDNTFQIIEQRVVGESHLKLSLRLAEDSPIVDAIAFNAVDFENWPNFRLNQVKTAYRLDVNEFRGKKSVQLIIEYLEGI